MSLRLIFSRVLADYDVDQGWAVLIQGAFERRFDGVGMFDALSVDAEGFGEPGEVDFRTGDLGAHLGGDTNALLGTAELIFDRHVSAIIEDDDDQRNAILGQCPQTSEAEHRAAVAQAGDHTPFRRGELGTDGGAQAPT